MYRATVLSLLVAHCLAARKNVVFFVADGRQTLSQLLLASISANGAQHTYFCLFRCLVIEFDVFAKRDRVFLPRSLLFIDQT